MEFIDYVFATVFVVISTVGIIGNLLVIIVMIVEKKLREMSASLFITSVAIADLSASLLVV